VTCFPRKIGPFPSPWASWHHSFCFSGCWGFTFPPLPLHKCSFLLPHLRLYRPLSLSLRSRAGFRMVGSPSSGQGESFFPLHGVPWFDPASPSKTSFFALWLFLLSFYFGRLILRTPAPRRVFFFFSYLFDRRCFTYPLIFFCGFSPGIPKYSRMLSRRFPSILGFPFPFW